MIKSAALFVSILLLANPLCAETPNSIIAGAIVNDWTQAGLRVTDKLFDFGIQGRGFFVLRTSNGVDAYSRYGEMRTDEDGVLVHSSSGMKVLGFFEGTLDTINLGDFARGPDGSILKGFRTKDNAGTLEAVYENGRTRQVCVLALAVFSDSTKLKLQTHHILEATSGSGPAYVGKPGEDGRGSIWPSTLEEMDRHMYGLNLKSGQQDRIIVEREKSKMAFDQWVSQSTLFYVYDLKLSRLEFNKMRDLSRDSGLEIQNINVTFAPGSEQYRKAVEATERNEEQRALIVLGRERLELMKKFRNSFNKTAYENYGVTETFTGF